VEFTDSLRALQTGLSARGKARPRGCKTITYARDSSWSMHNYWHIVHHVMDRSLHGSI